MASEIPAPLSPETLRQWTGQLGHWAESFIRGGRSPLRKVETFPALITAEGEFRPPLLFWINRDSCMAGGVVLFPADNDAESMAAGRLCARALGLRYFVTWTRDGVFFWDEGNPPRLRKKQLLPGKNPPAAQEFQQTLQWLLEEIKLLAVLAAVPSPDLSPCYLANLWRVTLQKTVPLLEQAQRIARSEHYPDSRLPRQLAVDKAYLTLFRLLALCVSDRLPAETQPARLEGAMLEALHHLPRDLARGLAPPPAESLLPEAVGVVYHLLFRRLTQLRAAGDRHRCREALTLLLAHDRLLLGGRRPPSPPAACRSALWLNPDQASQSNVPALEFGPSALLAGVALQRHLLGLKPVAQATSLWQIGEDFLPDWIGGSLAECRPLADAERQRLLILLRRSWPNRRLSLPSSSPAWAWQMLHLLGLAAEQALLDLRLPTGWLNSGHGRAILGLLQQHFTVVTLAMVDQETLNLQMTKSPTAGSLSLLIRQDMRRSLEWDWLKSRHTAVFDLALHLPAGLFRLLQNGSLSFPTDTNWQEKYNEAAFAFTRSSFGRALWQRLGEGRPLPRRATLKQQFLRTGLPLPAAKFLQRLQLALESTPPESDRSSLCDQELTLWLGRDLLRQVADIKEAWVPAISSGATGDEPANPAGMIAGEVFVDGLPRFPEHYLYDHYRPQLRDYSFTPPLSTGSEFFGRVILSDGAQQTIEVDNPDIATALLLVAAAGRCSVSLPVDSGIAADIVRHYLRDLNSLRQKLNRCCHRHCADPAQAEYLTETLWSDQPLPPWSTVFELSCL